MATATTTYGLDDFCRDCREAIRKDPGDGGREIIRDRMAVLIRNEDFVAEHFGPERPFGTTTLYASPTARNRRRTITASPGRSTARPSGIPT